VRRRQEPAQDVWAGISDDVRRVILATALDGAERRLRDAMVMRSVRLVYPRAIDARSWPAVGC
jgi:hypothetical protein